MDDWTKLNRHENGQMLADPTDKTVSLYTSSGFS